MRTDVFHQIGVDSAALGLLSSSVHRFGSPGRYAGTVYVGDDVRGEYDVVVDDDGRPATQIDLSTYGPARRRGAGACCGTGDDRPRPTYHVAVGGYVSFYVGSGTERWATVVGDPREKGPEFDSRRLLEGDLFAASVLRPGRYVVRNTLGEGRTELVVPAVHPGKEPYRPADPIHTRMATFAGRASIRLGQAQGLVFTVSEPARVLIELDEAFDD